MTRSPRRGLSTNTDGLFSIITTTIITTTIIPFLGF